MTREETQEPLEGICNITNQYQCILYITPEIRLEPQFSWNQSDVIVQHSWSNM